MRTTSRESSPGLRRHRAVHAAFSPDRAHPRALLRSLVSVGVLAGPVGLLGRELITPAHADAFTIQVPEHSVNVLVLFAL
jgi:hypothetical protein